MQELIEGMTAVVNGKEAVNKVFAHPLPYNVIPQIDVFQPNKYTKEEMKVAWESRKIMDAPDLKVSTFYFTTEYCWDDDNHDDEAGLMYGRAYSDLTRSLRGDHHRDRGKDLRGRGQGVASDCSRREGEQSFSLTSETLRISPQI